MTTMPRPIYETKEDKDIDLAHLFDTIINNRIFEKISVILFLNKVDLLVNKVRQSSILHYFPEFE